MTLVNRESEAHKLRALSDRGEPTLALLYGRRRIGKTFLLTRIWSRDRAFYFTGSSTTPEQNRRQLIREAAAWSGEDLREEDHPTWRSVFRALLDLAPGRALVVVLDEFQYLGEDAEDLATVASELNAAWETPRERRSLLMVLAGSAVRTMEALDSGGASLYGRFTWKGELKPFDYLDAAEMADFPECRDRAYAYGIYGGTPRYLAPIDSDRTLAENVSEQILAPRGEVRGQTQTALLQEEGLRDIPKYIAILNAIGAGRTELNQIAGGAGLDHDTALRDKVERLVDLAWVERRRNLDAGRTSAFRYRLADPAQIFYHTFVLRFESALEVYPAEEIWRTRIVGDPLDTYMGPVFERIVEQAYRRLQGPLGLPSVLDWSRWEGVARDGDPVEVDLACRLGDGRVLSGAIKWNRSPLDPRWHDRHVDALRRLSDSGLAWAHQAREPDAPLLYVAAGGFSQAFVDAVQESDRSVLLWTLEDLYRTPEVP